MRAVRNPFGPRLPMRSSQLMQRPNLWTRYAQLRILGGFARRFRSAVAQEGFVTTDGTLGIEVTGTLDETLFHAIAESIPEGTWEFVCHPRLQRCGPAKGEHASAGIAGDGVARADAAGGA